MVGEDFTISFSLSEPDPGDDTIIQWSVDWGDGVVETLPSDAGSATHRYDTTGDFVVTVTATDEDGSYPEEVDPAVSPPVPAISTAVTVADLTIREGDGVTLRATAPAHLPSRGTWTALTRKATEISSMTPWESS